MTIREMQEKDIAPITGIIASHVEQDGPCAAKYYAGYFKRLAEESTVRECNYVAVDDAGAVIGVCGYGPDKYETPGVIWLNWFYVDKDHVGGLAGYRLFEKCMTNIRRLDTRKLCLDTSSYAAYHRAIQFYEKAGFKLEGELTDYYGKEDHMLIMSLSLEP